jgi:hypothetical protein
MSTVETSQLRRAPIRESDDLARRREIVCCTAALLDAIAQHLGEVPRALHDQAVQAGHTLLRE